MGCYYPKYDCWVCVTKLPRKVRGMITLIDGAETILIDETLSDGAQAEALEHELNHLKRCDLYSCEPVELIEEDNNKELKGHKD